MLLFMTANSTFDFQVSLLFCCIMETFHWHDCNNGVILAGREYPRCACGLLPSRFVPTIPNHVHCDRLYLLALFFVRIVILRNGGIAATSLAAWFISLSYLSFLPDCANRSQRTDGNGLRWSTLCIHAFL